MPKSEIEKLLQSQKARLAGTELSKLPPDLQIEFCQTNKQIGELAYQAHQETKHDPATALESAYYFSLAVAYSVEKAFADLDVKSTDSNVAVDINAIKSLENVEEIFKHGICYLMGIGDCSQNYSIAYQLFETAAKKGSVSAQNYLGYMHGRGLGVAEDHVEAVKWYRLAAEQGNALAQTNLGYMYTNGLGVDKDDVEAVKWYRLAAEQGYALAQNNLGCMYEDGLGVPRDYFEAVKWYRLAAEQGYALAQNNLGSMYEAGWGVAKSDQLATRWHRLAAEQNQKESIVQIAKKDTLATKYHAAMLAHDIEAVIKLLMQEEATFAELLWDIERSSNNSVLLDTVFNIIQQLQQKGIKLDRYAAAINDLYTRKVLLDHENKIQSNEPYNENDLDSLHKMLEHINFSDLDIKHIHPVINLLIDTWYAATNIDIDKFTSRIAGYLTNIIYKLNSQNEPTLDEYSVRQCATILIKHHIGERYEVSFDGFGLHDLVMLLPCIQRKKSASEINQFIGKNIIKEINFSDDVIKHVVTLLANYLQQNTDKLLTSPYLIGLNRCLTKVDKSLNNKHEMRNVMLSLLNYTSEYKSAKDNCRMFALNSDEMEKNIYRCLKKQELSKLVSLLESPADRVKFNMVI